VQALLETADILACAPHGEVAGEVARGERIASACRRGLPSLQSSKLGLQRRDLLQQRLDLRLQFRNSLAMRYRYEK
ncbi:hypothetical protein D6779_01590, partial [Candidatus Parcubacteria bacterium]